MLLDIFIFIKKWKDIEDNINPIIKPNVGLIPEDNPLKTGINNPNNIYEIVIINLSINLSVSKNIKNNINVWSEILTLSPKGIDKSPLIINKHNNNQSLVILLII